MVRVGRVRRVFVEFLRVLVFDPVWPLFFCCSQFADGPGLSSGRSAGGADGPFFSGRLWCSVCV
jgi:hypothetical protein